MKTPALLLLAALCVGGCAPKPDARLKELEARIVQLEAMAVPAIRLKTIETRLDGLKLRALMCESLEREQTELTRIVAGLARENVINTKAILALEAKPGVRR